MMASLPSEPSERPRQALREPWNRLTLTGLVEMAARARPAKACFIDPSDAGDWAGRPPMRVTSLAFEAMADRIARQLRTLGLDPGDAVLVVMPNQVETLAALVAIMMAGFVPCPLPVIATPLDIRGAAEAARAKAIVTTTRFAHLRPAAAAALAASEFFGIRFVCVFGDAAPDGVVSLDDWADEDIPRGPLPKLSPGDPALISFDVVDGFYRPFLRTHAQIVAEALSLAAVAGLNLRSHVLATFAPVSAVGVVSSLAAPLLTGATVMLHGPFSSTVLAEQLAAAQDVHVVIPRVVEQAVRVRFEEQVSRLIVIDRLNEAFSDQQAPGPQQRIVDVVSVGESATLTLSRGATSIGLPRHYMHATVGGFVHESPVVTLESGRDGQLVISGFGVARSPDRRHADPDDPLATRFSVVRERGDRVWIAPCPPSAADAA